MRRPATLLVAAVVAAALILAAAAPSGAITFGQPDGNRHPYAGALVADVDPFSPGPDVFCSGTLIAADVVLTAGHCAPSFSRIGVTFDTAYDEDAASPAGIVPGTVVTHPDFGFSGPGGASDPHDLAVVLLDDAPGIAPAQLPTEGLLDELGHKALRSATFTVVGYGAVREVKTGGPHGLVPPDGVRRFALSSFRSLQAAWLSLSQQPSTGDAGACFGDSGGPVFLGGETSNQLVSITSTGDAVCRAAAKSYRIDTASAREFLGEFVDLP
jgi:Trypsin